MWRKYKFRGETILRRFIPLLIVLSLFLLPGSARSAEDVPGVIQGKIINGTEGGEVASDQKVALETYVDGVKQNDTIYTTIDPENQFQFDGLSTDAAHLYVVSAIYRGVDYYSDALSFTEGENNVTVELTLFEATESDETITVLMEHTIIFAENEDALVKEYLLFANVGDRTYIGNVQNAAEGARQTLRFSLPINATNLQPNPDIMPGVIVNGQQFYDILPVPPGMREIAYSYTVDLKDKPYMLDQKIEYHTGSYDLLVQGSDIEVESNQLTGGEYIDIDGQRYLRLSGGEFDAGTLLEIKLSAASAHGGPGIVLWLPAVLIPIVAASAIGFAFLRKRRSQAIRPEPAESTNNDLERQRLLLEIAHLDDAFEQGNILETEYQQLRKEKKAELIRLMNESGPDS